MSTTPCFEFHTSLDFFFIIIHAYEYFLRRFSCNYLTNIQTTKKQLHSKYHWWMHYEKEIEKQNWNHLHAIFPIWTQLLHMYINTLYKSVLFAFKLMDCAWFMLSPPPYTIILLFFTPFQLLLPTFARFYFHIFLPFFHFFLYFILTKVKLCCKDRAVRLRPLRAQ